MESDNYSERYLGKGGKEKQSERAIRVALAAASWYRRRAETIFLTAMPQEKFAKARTPSPAREKRALPEYLLQCTIDSGENSLLPEDFEQMIKARAGDAAGDGEPCRVDERCRLHPKSHCGRL